MKINGNRINLRFMTYEDVPFKVQWANDPDINKFIGLKLPITLEKTSLWFKEKSKDDTCKLFIIESKDKQPIGYMRLDLFKIKNKKKGELHIIIGNKSFQGKGLGKEAVKLFLKYCFEIQELNAVFLTTTINNVKAKNLYAKLGFKEIKILNNHKNLNGITYDSVLMELTSKNRLK